MAHTRHLFTLLAVIAGATTNVLAVRVTVTAALKNGGATWRGMTDASSERVCAALRPVLRCSHHWSSGFSGEFAEGRGVTPDDLVARIKAEAIRVVGPAAEGVAWTAHADARVAGDGEETREWHVTSQSDFSEFFVEYQLDPTTAFRGTRIAVDDPAIDKVQKNAPQHLRAIAGAEPGDGVSTFRFSRMASGVRIYVVDGAVSPHAEFLGLYDARSRVDAANHTSASARASIAENAACATAHGTHVASLAAGYSYGVAKNASIVSIGVQPGCGASGYASDLIQGLSWVYDHYTAHPAPRAPAVVTMSLLVANGGAAIAIERVVDDLVAAGVIVVAAAGNYGQDACDYVPARMSNVVTVAAMDEADREPWGWSNRGSCVDVWAPGENVIGAGSDCFRCTAVYSGTSQATPIVTGVIAHFLEREPAASVGDVLDHLRSTGGPVTGLPAATSVRFQGS